MLKATFATFIPVVIFYLALGILNLKDMRWRRDIQKRNRRSPLTKSMLRSPGESLRNEIDELEVDHRAFLMLALSFPFIVLSFGLSQALFIDLSLWHWILYAAATIAVFVFWTLRKMYAIKEKIRNCTLGMEGEIATGQELNQLMLHGCRVFHDLPSEYGNIDHIVVSQSGVFSVETKTLSKENESGSHKATIDFTKNMVQFSDRKWRLPIDQLETNSRWLSQYLTNSTGMEVKAESILALPGYYIEKRIGKGKVLVINPTKPKKFFVHSRTVFTPEQIQRIAHQIEQLCRDVEPSFRNQKTMEA